MFVSVLAMAQRGHQRGSGGMANVALAQGLPGEQWQRAPCGENMGDGKGAHEKVSLIAKRCEASMPPVNAHRNTISFRNIGASLGREAKQGAEVAWFWGVGAN
jgi:hypothetical protein